MPLVIKGKLIDKKSPLVCVPIVEKTYEDIINQATRLRLKHAEMVEWRADFYEDLLDEEKLKELLAALKSIFSQTVFLTTVRSTKEGGNADLDEDEMEKLLDTIAKTRCVDMIDVEYFEYLNPTELIKTIQGYGCAVIASFHDFDKTPKKAVLLRLLEEMEKSDADILKIAVMPNATSDVFVMGEAANEFSDSYPNSMLIMISMKSEGVISRIAPGAFSSCVTFGTDIKASAPGQIEMGKLRELIDFTGEFYQ